MPQPLTQAQDASPRRDYIDVLKGLGILLVVFGHFMEQYRLGSHLIGALDRAASRFWALRVISGLLLLGGYGFHFWQMRQYENPAPASSTMFRFTPEALGVICLLYSTPVNRVLNTLASLWYRPRTKRF